MSQRRRPDSVASRTMARLRDVADRAGVSLSVASRALTNDAAARISDETRARVLQAADELNYVPDQRARALRLSRSGAIALVVPEVNNAVFAAVYQGVQAECAARQVAVLLGQIDRSDAGRVTALSTLIGHGRVDGVILQRSEQFTDEDVSSVIDVDVPVVLFNSTLGSHSGSVALDDAAAVEVAMTHLREHGHREIGFIAGPPNHDAATRRRDAFIRLATDWGMHVADGWDVPEGWDADAGHRALLKLIRSDRPPTAVLAANVNAGIGALAAAAQHGVVVPDDLSVIAIQDTWMAAYVTPRLTTVRLPLATAGASAAALLLDHLDGAELDDVVIAEPAPELALRTSVAAPPARS